MKININTDKTYNDIIENIITQVKQIKKIKSGRPNKETLETYCKYILFVLITGASWADLDLIPGMSIKSDTIRKKFNLWTNNGIFDNLFNILLNEYIINNKPSELFIDSYDCLNLNGTKENVKMGHKYKNKNVCKITLLTDKNKIPIGLDICKGNINDNKRIEYIANVIPKSINRKYQKPLKICGDKGYIINKERRNALRINYKIIIITDKRKNMKKRITKENKILLKKRIIIEHLNSILRRRFKHLSRISDKNEKGIKRWFMLSFIYLLLEHKNKKYA